MGGQYCVDNGQTCYNEGGSSTPALLLGAVGLTILNAFQGGADPVTDGLEGADLAALAGTGAEDSGAATRVFWTGGDEAKVAATKFATENGGETIGMTEAGRALEASTANMDYATEAKPLWETASYNFARGASGPVHVFINFERAWEGSIWAQTELPALVDNQSVPDVFFHILGG